MPPKQIIILSSFVPAHNQSPVAVNRKMLQMCCSLVDKVTFVTANFPADSVADSCFHQLELVNVPVDFSKSNFLNTILSYIKMQIYMLPILRKIAPVDVPVFFWLSGPMIIPFLYCKLKGIQTVGFLYGNSRLKSGRYNLLNLLKSCLMRFMAIHADAACVESPGVLTQWGYSPQDVRFHTMHLFVDTRRFCEHVSPPQRPWVVGMCCRLVANKRVLESIEAFHLFRQSHPQFIMEIVGSGPLATKCRNRINQLGESEYIKMIGWVALDQMPSFLNRWRLLLHPTNYEGLPNSLIEAMCCSTPVLSSPAGGVVDVIQDGVTGWILPNSSPTTICKYLEEILSSNSWADVAERAGQYARKEYCQDSALETLRKVCSIL